MSNFNKSNILIILITSIYLKNSCENYPIESSLYNESTILNLVEKFLPKNPIILEAGAHYGEDTKIIAQKFPGCQLHAFEPLESSFNILKETTKFLPNVYCYKRALGNKKGKSNFYLCTNNDGASSIFSPRPILDPHLVFSKNIMQVRMTTIDTWARNHNVKRIDFMWLDMEGAEKLALEASPKIMKTVKIIYTEVNYPEMHDGGCFYFEIKKFLEDNGFTEVWNHSWKTGNVDWQGNVLFVRLNQR